MEKKYKLTEETINVNGSILHRIEALKDFANIKKGDKGGFIEKEKNLSQRGDCWVYGDATIYDDAMVCGNAEVYGNARVYYNANVYDDAKVYNYAQVRGNAEVYDNAKVCGNADVYGIARIYGYAQVCDNAEVCNNAEVYGYSQVSGNAEICGDAEITSNSDYILFKNWWSSGRHFTWTKSNNMWKVGCFYGTGEELIDKAYKDSEKSGREYEKIVKYVESILEDNNADV